jgi:hypothetical protein
VAQQWLDWYAQSTLQQWKDSLPMQTGSPFGGLLRLNLPQTDFDFNEEQVRVIALLVWPLEQAWRKHLEFQHAQGPKAGKLQRQVRRCVIIGGGGCGKTTIMQVAEDQMRKRLHAKQRHAGAWIHDEAQQRSATHLHMAALRTTYARQHTSVALCSEHLQLPPLPKSNELLVSLQQRLSAASVNTMLQTRSSVLSFDFAIADAQ